MMNVRGDNNTQTQEPSAMMPPKLREKTSSSFLNWFCRGARAFSRRWEVGPVVAIGPKAECVDSTEGTP